MTSPFLRIPPFPGRKKTVLAEPCKSSMRRPDIRKVAQALRTARVGGRFWGARPPLPARRDILLVPDTEAQLAAMLAALAKGEAERSLAIAPPHWIVPEPIVRIEPNLDPWWLADHITDCRTGANQELALVAALAGKRVSVTGSGNYEAVGSGLEKALREVLLGRWRWFDPFTGAEATVFETIETLQSWRELIDRNRCFTAVHGIAAWKRVTVVPLLWGGLESPSPDGNAMAGRSDHGCVAVWKSRTKPATLRRLESSGSRLAELEDGFIRSVGLGANCVPPLSLICDFSGVYFDPSGPSDLEAIMENYHISEELRCRAAALRQQLVKAAISKYAQGGTAIIRPQGNRRRVLVTGQVEDDRSILSGGAGTSNLALLERARAMEGDAWIVYKPHPDVEAGHRKGHVPAAEALRFADEVQRDAPIVPLIDSVDALHVITSLAGFEALLRGKRVTTHGVPFYAGWGLTRDLAPIPARRTRQRSLDELVAAALLLYPRYVDPVTRLPCPAEVLVQRMEAGQARVVTPLIRLREWQGRARALWRNLAGGA